MTTPSFDQSGEMPNNDGGELAAWFMAWAIVLVITFIRELIDWVRGWWK